MNPDAFNEFAATIRRSGVPGGELVIWLTAVTCGYTLIPAAAGAPEAVTQ